MAKATVKDYETLVKRIRETPEDQRAELAQDKSVVVNQLIDEAKAKGHDARRKLKFAMDEINNS